MFRVDHRNKIIERKSLHKFITQSLDLGYCNSFLYQNKLQTDSKYFPRIIKTIYLYNPTLNSDIIATEFI